MLLSNILCPINAMCLSNGLLNISYTEPCPKAPPIFRLPHLVDKLFIYPVSNTKIVIFHGHYNLLFRYRSSNVDLCPFDLYSIILIHSKIHVVTSLNWRRGEIHKDIYLRFTCHKNNEVIWRSKPEYWETMKC